MISEVTAAINAKLGLGRPAVIHPYPTQAEAVRQVRGLYQPDQIDAAA